MSAEKEIDDLIAAYLDAARAMQAAVRKQYAIDAVQCGLCREMVPGEKVSGVWVAERTVEGRALWSRGELWCPGCSRLALGLESARNASIPKGTG